MSHNVLPIFACKHEVVFPYIGLLPPILQSADNEIQIQISRQSLVVSEGDDVNIACITSNNAPPLSVTIQWVDSSGNVAPMVANTLSLPSISRTQRGEYYCVITSIRNETSSASLSINVECEHLK